MLTRYFRNDIANASLHWLALGIEETIRRPDGAPDIQVLLQYYRYW